ncbi:MAG: right-handed parallel beta-helix repeat-containing protein [Bacteroidales bacterium]|nr:right-handed parallel beta-helix repeat-containing protein [Bacteroidales bacterium]
MAIIFVIILAVAGVASVTRMISDSSDNSYTFIRNSNGNFWETTGSNIQNAIDDLGSDGGTVYLPAGTLTPTDIIYLNSNIRLIGSGIGVTIIKAESGYGSTMIRTSSAARQNNVTISDITIDGNNMMGNCLYFHSVTDFLVENIYIKDSTSNGFGCFGNCNRGIISQVKASGLTGSYEGLAINGAKNCIFSDCEVWDKNGPAQAMDFHGIDNCTISNMQVHDSTYGIKVWGESGDYSEDNVISNINCYNIGNTGGGLWIKATKRTSLTNIHISGSNNGIVIDGSEDINLHNFYIENPDNIGLYISDYISDCHRVNIGNGIVKCTGNTVRGFSIKDGRDITISKLQIFDSPSYNLIQSVEDFKLSDSIFESGNDMGLSIQSSSHFSIIGCTFKDNNGDAIDTTSSPCNNYIISNCIFSNNELAIDTTSSDNYYIITNNICHGDNIDADSGTSTKVVEDNIGNIE